MENDKYVTRNELNTDRRLTKVETNDKWFRWFLSAAIAVGAIGAAALIGIYSLLFSLQDDVATLTADVEVIDSRMDKFDTRMDNFETRMDKFETRMDNFETRMDKFETHMDKFEVRLGNIEYYLKFNGGVPPPS